MKLIEARLKSLICNGLYSVSDELSIPRPKFTLMQLRKKYEKLSNFFLSFHYVFMVVRSKYVWRFKSILNILRILTEIDCCHCVLVVKRGTDNLKVVSVSYSRGLQVFAFRIPLNGCGFETQISNPIEWLWFRNSNPQSPGEALSSRIKNLSRHQTPQFDPSRHTLLSF